MINKENWKLVKEYLDDREHVDQIAIGSLKIEKTYTRYLLEWAEENPFLKAPSILANLTRIYAYCPAGWERRATVGNTYQKSFGDGSTVFYWLAENNQGYRSLKQTWINSLKA